MRRLDQTIRATLVVACLACGPAIAHGQERASDLASPRPPPSAFALDASAMTILPLVLGATIGLEVPGHVVVRVGVGFVPAAYVDALGSIAGAGQTMSLLLSDATVLEVGLAFRPSGTPGLELGFGYLMLWSHRRIDMSQLGGAASGVGLDVTIDGIHGEVAWQTEPVEHLFLRVAVGWADAFDHRVAIRGDGDASAQEAFRTAADALTTVVGQHAFGPTFGLALGARI